MVTLKAIFTMSPFKVLLALALSTLSVLALSLNGADFSSLAMLESEGQSYSENGSIQPFERILAGNGFELARIRVWTAGTYTQSYALALAKRAKAVGMKVLIDLHYSDTCAYQKAIIIEEFSLNHIAEGADPGHQAIPSAWPTDLDSLNTQIYT